MSDYAPHLFYDITTLTLQQKKELCVEAHSKCYEWKVDKLDCNESWSRQEIEMSLEDILKMLDNRCHFVVIHRRGFVDSKDEEWWRWKLEIGFNTMKGISHYLWIFLNESEIPYFTEKYSLKLK